MSLSSNFVSLDRMEWPFLPWLLSSANTPNPLTFRVAVPDRRSSFAVATESERKPRC